MYEDNNEEPYDRRDENFASSEDDETSHYCEVCDREFETADLLQRHNETHRICGIDDCTFSAHPKLVEKHISMQHCTGLYHRLKNLSTPEDIDKWICERKKKYPTKTNVERKEAEEKEKRKRGEIIGKEKPVRDSTNQTRDKKRKIRKRRRREPQVKPERISKLYRGLLPFAGTENLPESKDASDEEQPEIVEKIEDEILSVTCDISDEDDESMGVKVAKVPVRLPEVPCELPEVCSKNENQSALGCLMANYCSSSEENEAPEEVPIKRTRAEVPSESESIPVTEKSAIEQSEKKQSTKNAPEVNSNLAKNPRTSKFRDKSSTEKQSNRPRKTFDDRHYSQKRLMLLQRLLSRSIQHERNLICQCIKYIADNNFFLE